MTNHLPIQVWLSNWLSNQRLSTDFSVKLLIGDGSSRSFFRVETAQQKYIAISDPQWTQTQDYPAHQSFLENLGLPVPKFFCSDPSQGFLLMQDLGDELLQLRIQSEPEKKLSWLENSVKLLANLHGKTFPTPKNLPVSNRTFDAEKYFSELMFTFEFLHQKLLNQSKLSDSNKAELFNFCQIIAQIEPLVFSHRDFHCRNLIVNNGKLWMIDFQDARLGSPHYDLASLIYDAYLPLTDNDRQKLIELYRTELAKFPLAKKIAWHIFESDLKQVAFQRTIKAAGSFASFFIRYGKTTHWPYLSPALNSALNLQASGFGVKSNVINIEKWLALISQLQIQ